MSDVLASSSGNPAPGTTRRGFARTLAGSALATLSMPAVLRGRNLAETLNIALVGVGAAGPTTTRRSPAWSRTSLRFATWTRTTWGQAARRSPRAKTYHDFRRMFDELHGQIDAVVVSTPDHTHAVIAKAALELGKHVYCEKPLTHSIHEARVLAETAARHKLATQMGNAGHSSEGTRRVVELIRAGAIGPVREVHAWTNRPIWPQAVDRPADQSARSEVAALGPLARPRARASLSSGLSPVQVARLVGFWHRRPGRHGLPHHRRGLLGPRAARSAEHRGREPAGLTLIPRRPPPGRSSATSFQARGSRPPVKLIWYDGGKLPPLDLFDGHAPAKDSSGSIFVGEKGRLLVQAASEDGATGFFPNATSPASSRPSPRCRAHPATMPSGSRPARPASPPGPASTTPARSPSWSCWATSRSAPAGRSSGTAAGMRIDQRVDRRSLHPSRLPPWMGTVSEAMAKPSDRAEGQRGGPPG